MTAPHRSVMIESRERSSLSCFPDDEMLFPSGRVDTLKRSPYTALQDPSLRFVPFFARTFHSLSTANDQDTLNLP